MTPLDSTRRQFLQAAAATAAVAFTSAVHAADDELPYGIIDVIESDPVTGTSAAVIVGDVPLVHTWQVGVDAKKNSDTIPPADDVAQITIDLKAAIEELTPLLRSAGSSLQQVVKLNFYVSHANAVAVVCDWLKATFPTQYRPAASFVVSSADNLRYHSFVTLDSIATRRDAVPAGTIVRTDGAAVLPPTHKLYISGDAAKGSLMQVVAETLRSLEICLQHCGLNWSHVVQLKTFLQPIILASDVAREIRTFFGDRPVPVLTFVEWQSSDTVPMETELIAAVPPELSNPSGDTVEYLNPPHKPGNAVFTRIARVRSDRTIYTSGLYGEPSDADGEIRGIFDRLKKLIERAGSDMQHLVKATYYVSDDVTSKRLGEIRPEYYDPKRPPAASKAKVGDVARERKTIMVDMIAVPKP